MNDDKKLDSFLREHAGEPPAPPASEFESIQERTQRRPFWSLPTFWVPAAVAACVTFLMIHSVRTQSSRDEQLEAFLNESLSVVSEPPEEIQF